MSPRIFALLAFLIPLAGTAEDESVFLSLSTAEADRVEIIVSETRFKDGFPRRYLRHRLVKVDKEKLRQLLDSDWAVSQVGGSPKGVPLNLFDDLTVQIVVEQVIHNDFHGAGGYFGRFLTDRSGVSRFNVMFYDTGHFKATVRTDTASYLIENVLDNSYFLVLEQRPLDHAFD